MPVQRRRTQTEHMLHLDGKLLLYIRAATPLSREGLRPVTLTIEELVVETVEESCCTCCEHRFTASGEIFVFRVQLYHATSTAIKKASQSVTL